MHREDDNGTIRTKENLESKCVGAQTRKKKDALHSRSKFPPFSISHTSLDRNTIPAAMGCSEKVNISTKKSHNGHRGTDTTELSKVQIHSTHVLPSSKDGSHVTNVGLLGVPSGFPGS